MSMRSVKCLVVGDEGVGAYSVQVDKQSSLFKFQVNDFIETGKTSLLITYANNMFPNGEYCNYYQYFSIFPFFL